MKINEKIVPLNMAAVILQLKETRPVCLLYVWSSLKNKAIWAKEA